MSTPIPYAALGRDGKVAQRLHELLMPDYELVHACLDLEKALAELPSVCAGDLDTPIASGVGTNVDRPVAERQTPEALVFGGGTTDPEVDAIVAAVNEKQPKGGPEVKMVRVTKEDIQGTGAPGPTPEAIAVVLREKLGMLFKSGEY